MLTTPVGATVSLGVQANLVDIPGGRTFVGVDDPELPKDGEGPERFVRLKAFRLEAETVNVDRFAKFVSATGYITEAERFGWSVVFTGGGEGPLTDPGLSATPWWSRINGAYWAAPEGPGSSVAERLDHPVTQVSWNDACAFADWVRGRLPTEAEWEHAARGGATRKRFPWGDAEPTDDNIFCNIWQGHFPDVNTAVDGYVSTAPSYSFAPNAFGLYNMVGNVWEWNADLFKIHSVSNKVKALNALASKGRDRVLKGGSFLCHRSYCYRYRIASRLRLGPDSASNNMGFRVAYDMSTAA